MFNTVASLRQTLRRQKAGAPKQPLQKRTRQSLIDHTYSRIFNQDRFFVDGWGPAEIRQGFESLPDRVGEAAQVDVLWTHQEKQRGLTVKRGVFLSPIAHKLPPESRRASMCLILPAHPGRLKSVYIHLAATGDEGFGRRFKAFAEPLARRGVASLILENAFYGQRRPETQRGVYLREFSDLLLMGEATVREGRALVRWLKEGGYDKIGVTGVSMGGHMSTLVGAVSSSALAIVPCIGMHSAAPVFTEGVLSQKIDWEKLGEDIGGREEAVRQMREVLNYSDVRKYPKPRRPDATICVSATRDAYINNDSIRLLQTHWDGSEVRWVKSGHVRAFVSHSGSFLKAMHDALGRLEEKEDRR